MLYHGPGAEVVEEDGPDNMEDGPDNTYHVPTLPSSAAYQPSPSRSYAAPSPGIVIIVIPLMNTEPGYSPMTPGRSLAASPFHHNSVFKVSLMLLLLLLVLLL